MRWKVVGVVSIIGAFAGCGASPEDSRQGDDVEVVTSAAGTCQSFTATVQDHLNAGRVIETDTQFLFWTFTTYVTSGLGPTVIGASPTQVVTLYPKAGGYTLNAAECRQSTCGNGVLEAPPELCDGDHFFSGDLANPDGVAPNCSAFGASPPWASGTVKCTADCKYDMSDCRTSVCGDGKIDGLEACDGQNLGSITTCQQATDYGVFTGGQLKCSSTCTLDVSGCTSLCGNGVIDTGEDCDGPLFSPQYTAKSCSDFQVPYPVWPFGLRNQYSPGALHCNKFCKVDLPSLCTTPPGCYYVPAAGSQPSIGVRCL